MLKTANASSGFEAILLIDSIRTRFKILQEKQGLLCQPAFNLMYDTRQMLKIVKESAECLGFDSTIRKVQYLQDEYGERIPDRNAVEIVSDLEHLGVELVSDAQAVLFLRLDSARAKFYLADDPQAAPFGEAVHNAFPSAIIDAREASNCYALERWPACVFHLMRVLEFGLGVMAKRFNVSVERSTWHQIIEAIEGRIRKIDPQSGADWKKQQKDFSDAATQFMFFKDAWRNHIMHVRDQYDEGRAMSIWQHTNEFMNKLAAIGLHEEP
ncbi:MAG TPA: hypothetical protein VG714_07935 [Acidobacteriaceae bacterium]|nr:hypothetical protein [Acidobacteriaceae bacterium]